MVGIVINDNGTTKPVNDFFVNDNGTVKTVNEAFVNDNGTVKLYYSAGLATGIMTAEFVNANPGFFTFSGYDQFSLTTNSPVGSLVPTLLFIEEFELRSCLTNTIVTTSTTTFAISFVNQTPSNPLMAPVDLWESVTLAGLDANFTFTSAEMDYDPSDGTNSFWSIEVDDDFVDNEDYSIIFK